MPFVCSCGKRLKDLSELNVHYCSSKMRVTYVNEG